MPRVPSRKKKPLDGRKTRVIPYPEEAREYELLMERIGLNQLETGRLFEFAGRTSRRYKRGEAKVPLPTLILMRLMARGVISKRQVMRASVTSPYEQLQNRRIDG